MSSAQLGSLLCDAASRGDFCQVQNLLENEAPVRPCSGPLGNNALHCAAMNGHLETCKVLLKWGMNKEFTNRVGKTALHLAATNNHEAVVELLLSSGAFVDPMDMLKMTPLHWSCDRGNTSIALALAKYGANPQSVNKYNRTPLIIAREKNRNEILNFFQPEMRELQTEDGNHTLGNVVKETKLVSLMVEGEVDDLSAAFEEIPTISAEDLISEDSDNEIVEEEVDDEFMEFDDATPYRYLHVEEDIADDTEDYLLDSLLKMTENSKDCGIGTQCIDEVTEELLRGAEATLDPLEDPSQMISRALAHGCTIQLTEAGRRALDTIRPDPWFLPRKKRKDEEEKEKVSPQQNEMFASSALVPSPTSSEYFSQTAALNYLQEYASSLGFETKSFQEETNPPFQR